MKKCSKNIKNSTTKKVEGCEYIEWVNKAAKEKCEENCPQYGKKMIKW